MSALIVVPLILVPTELHAEHFAERGERAETRRSLFQRLVRAFLPERVFASRFAAFLAASDALGNPVLAKAIERTLDLLTDAHGSEHAAILAFKKGRLRGFKKEIEVAARVLKTSGLDHARTSPELLSMALLAADPEHVARVVGARKVTAQFIYDWSASDGIVFRALDVALSRLGGSATVLLPEVSEALDGTREESPHDIVSEACARAIDAAPRFVLEIAPSTWTGPVPESVRATTNVIRAADLTAEANACAATVQRALADGIAADAIGIALPARGGAFEAALFSALSEHGIRASHQDDEIADSAPVEIAFAALRDASEISDANGPRKTGPRAEYVQIAYKTWNALGLGERAGLGAFGVLATDAKETALDRAELDAVALSAAAWDALALTDYVAAMKSLGVLDKTISIDAFIAEARASMPGARDPASRRAGAVRIGTLLDFVGLPLDVLVIASANDGALDADTAGVDDALALRLLRERAAANAVKIASCLSQAARVTFTFRARDEDGGALAPAAFIAWLLRGGVPEAVTGASPFDPARRSRRAQRLRAISQSDEQAKKLVPHAHARALIERERESFFLDSTRRTSEVVGALVSTEKLRAIVTDETGGAERSLAVTALERAASCAFVGFAECVAGARKKLEEEAIPDTRTEGTLVHGALAAAFTACKDALWQSPGSRDLNSILLVGARAAEESLPPAVPGIIRARVQTTVAVLLREAAEDPKHRFFSAEQSFGENKSWPPHVIESGTERIALRGSIDRVDEGTDEKTARAIDYKRRINTIAKAVRSLGVTSLQVPLYARVVAKALGKSPGESGFLPTEPKDLADVSPPKALREAMDGVLAEDGGMSAIEKRAIDVVRELRLGNFIPLPVEPTTCALCSHDGACRKPRFSIEPEEKS